ncbi:MAG: ABC transporter substrate-binding protein [Clostridia bacterium]|nr:ABC transporter substrate-binding protein [Clostridia bacterium]
MKNFKKFVALALAFLMLFALCGCANNSNGDTFKIGLVKLVDHPSLNEINDAIKAEFTALGANVEIIEKNANGEASALPAIMQSLTGAGVDMIIPIATPTAQAAAAATSSIPIVFAAVSSPVEAGLTSSIEAPDKNVTGVSDAIPVEDIFKMATLLTPDVKTFGFFYNSAEINSVTAVNQAKAFCDKNGIAYKEATVSATADIQQTATKLASEVDALFTPIDNMVASAMPTYIDVTNKAGVPVYVAADSMVKEGGFATVGINYTLLGQQVARMADKILKGEKTISESPVELISEYTSMINMKEAKILGIEIPEELKANLTVLVD